LESLPYGILVANGQRKLLIPKRDAFSGSSNWAPEQGNLLPAALQKLFDRIPADSFFSEQKWLPPETPSNRSIGILHANVSELAEGSGDTIWIVRDITEQKRVASNETPRHISRAGSPYAYFTSAMNPKSICIC
jgi:hypothetical protein